MIIKKNLVREKLGKTSILDEKLSHRIILSNERGIDRINIEEFNNFSFNVLLCLASEIKQKVKRKLKGRKITEKSG